jgi:hypothetical protein
MATPFGGPTMISPRHLARGWRDQPCNDAQQRRLAGSGTAEQADDFTGMNRQIDVFEHQQFLAAAFRKRAADAVDIEQAGLFGKIEHQYPLINRDEGGARRRHKAASTAAG